VVVSPPLVSQWARSSERLINTVSIPQPPANHADTAVDYANIFEYLIDLWDIEHIGGLSGEAVRWVD